jgi:hypothetical protein
MPLRQSAATADLIADSMNVLLPGVWLLSRKRSNREVAALIGVIHGPQTMMMGTIEWNLRNHRLPALAR